MTVLAMTLPLARSSPVHLARRDLVTAAGDDLTLQLAIIADDTADAAPVNLTGATVEMRVSYGTARPEYGWNGWWSGHMLHVVTGTITNAAGGLATIVMPQGSMYCWGPRGAEYRLRLNLGGAETTLCRGKVNLSMALA